MRLPYLKIWDNMPVVVTITEGIAETGEPNVLGTYTGMCNYNEKTKTIRTSDGQFVNLNAVLTIGANIFPNSPTIEGSVEIVGKIWKIYSSSRGRNPDGSVQHTRLELM